MSFYIKLICFNFTDLQFWWAQDNNKKAKKTMLILSKALQKILYIYNIKDFIIYISIHSKKIDFGI